MLTNDIQNAYLGVDPVDRVYLGEDVIYEASGQSHDYSTDYLTIESAGSYILYKTPNTSFTPVIQVSANDGPWTAITPTTAGTQISLTNGVKYRFKGVNSTYCFNNNSAAGAGFQGGEGYFNVYGNIMSLVYGDNFVGQATFPTSGSYIFVSLFRQSNVVDASNLVLPATALTLGCYQGMFSGCRYLEAAPELPATTLTQSCYRSMFNNCTGLTTGPKVLPAETLAADCYFQLFNGCTGLSQITCLATNPDGYSTRNWVANVSPTGTFVKHPNTVWPTGTSGIPDGWTVEDAVI